MLYVKFIIEENEKFNDFKKLYNHLVAVRKPDFDFEDEVPEFDWNNMNEKEMEEALKKIDLASDKDALELKRYKNVIPEYANSFFKKYFQIDNDKLGNFGVQELLSIFNYLEFGFEVDLNNLEIVNNSNGIIEFSTGNFPFGGLERFFITLKAFSLIPTQCFDGFSVNDIKWETDFEYDFVELKKETEVYIKKQKC
ncbi:MAG: hypothetical protein ABJH82_02890 [Polaribacter sp.]|uniref:hypothetical protein n=1 Tax=Polaribacter sp. TaxID=1920175 RepID=UPI0032630CE1